jgi:hypothetical protein
MGDMGFYHGPSQPPPSEKEPGGCMEVLVISRAVFAVLAVPMLVLLGIIVTIVALGFLFSVHWALGLLGIAAIGGLAVLYARWERGKFRSTGP